MSSPLRRYVDLVNQWQLAAALAGRKPSFARNSDMLLAALRAFEVTAARYDEHQRNGDLLEPALAAAGDAHAA